MKKRRLFIIGLLLPAFVLLASAANLMPSTIEPEPSPVGLLFYGNVTIPFVDRFPRGEIYNLLTTRPEDLKKEWLS